MSEQVRQNRVRVQCSQHASSRLFEPRKTRMNCHLDQTVRFIELVLDCRLPFPNRGLTTTSMSRRGHTTSYQGAVRAWVCSIQQMFRRVAAMSAHHRCCTSAFLALNSTPPSPISGFFAVASFLIEVKRFEELLSFGVVSSSLHGIPTSRPLFCTDSTRTLAPMLLI